MIPQIIIDSAPQVGLMEVLPFAWLILIGLLLLGLDALLDFVKGMTNEKRDNILMVTTLLGLLVAGAMFFFDIIGGATGREPFLEGMFLMDDFGTLGSVIVILGALAFVFLSPKLVKERRLPAGELYALLIFSVSGMIMLTMANELLTAFICIEILSLSLYVIAGIDRRSRKSGEAAFKYFILGAFASAFLVMGIAFIFGATGTTQLFPSEATNAAYGEVAPFDQSIQEVLAAGERTVYVAQPTMMEVDGEEVLVNVPGHFQKAINPLWVFLGFGLLFVGLCFKLSLAPFHMWAPDVYEGAPTISAMLIATASKVSAFAFLVHVVIAMSAWPLFGEAAGFMIAAVAGISIMWGNIGALIQDNIKRMLAYSSVAHGGYIAMGVACLLTPTVLGDESGVYSERIIDAFLFYLFAYTLMNTLAFGIVAVLGKDGEGDIANYRGFAKRRPAMAFGMAVALISLMGLGVPGTVGFWGKYYIFKEAIDTGLIGLAIIGMIGSIISAFYYLRVVVAMYMNEEEEAPVAAGVGDGVATGMSSMTLIIVAFMTVLFGFLPLLFFMFPGAM